MNDNVTFYRQILTNLTIIIKDLSRYRFYDRGPVPSINIALKVPEKLSDFSWGLVQSLVFGGRGLSQYLRCAARQGPRLSVGAGRAKCIVVAE